MSKGEAPEAWYNGDEPGPICSGEACVWLLRLDLPQVELSALEALLSGDERHRADRFRFSADRQHFVAGRAILRLLLGSYLQAVPSKLEFQYGLSGKPSLDPRQNPEDLRFNTAHANGLALIGVTRGQEIGIDLEYQNGNFNYLGIADHFFSSPEKRALRVLPAGVRLQTFYDYWTRKEAYLKGIGSGLGVSLDQFSVPLGTGEPVLDATAATRSDSAPDEHERWVGGRWLVYDIAVPSGYSAALAVDGKISAVHHWEVAWHDRALVPVRLPLS